MSLHPVMRRMLYGYCLLGSNVLISFELSKDEAIPATQMDALCNNLTNPSTKKHQNYKLQYFVLVPS